MANYTASCKNLQIPATFTRLVLDPSAMVVKPTVADDECGPTQVELYNREYIYEIYKKRVAKLKRILTR